MGIRSWLARQLVKTAGIYAMPNWIRAGFIEPTFDHIVQEGVRANGVVLACVTAHFFEFPSARLTVFENHLQADRSPYSGPNTVTGLLRHPNPWMSQSELLGYISLYLTVGGNCYLHKVRSGAGRVIQLVPYSDAEVEPFADARIPTKVAHFKLQTDGGSIKILPEDMIHLKWMPDPLNPHTGLAPIIGVARDLDTDNEAASYIYALLKNDAVPRVAIVVPDGVNLDDEEEKALRAKWNDRYSGTHRGEFAILKGGLDVRVIGMDLERLAMDALRSIPEARLCAALRVPPEVAKVSVGLAASTYNNQMTSRRSFVEDTIEPMWSKVADEMDQGLRDEFAMPDEIGLGFDTSMVTGLAPRREERRAFAIAGWQAGILQLNEARAESGYPPLVGGEILRAETLGGFGVMGRTIEGSVRMVPQLGDGKKEAEAPTFWAGLTEEDVSDALAVWDEVMPDEYAGLLDAEVEGEA